MTAFAQLPLSSLFTPRPLTPEQYAMLTRQQLIAAGLADDEESAPQDFGGRVLPNPAHVRASWDTDGPPATRLPNGVTFKKDNWSGSLPLDVSNPNPADVIPAVGREIQSKTTGKPIELTPDQFMAAQNSSADLTPDSFMQAQPGPPKGMPLAPDAWGRLKQAYEGTLPILDYDMATLAGVGNIARNTVGAAKGVYNTAKEALNAWNDPQADVGDTILPDPHVEQVPGAVRDINASADPTGTYLKVAGDTAAQGAGQAITALATEGAVRGAPKALSAIDKLADTPIGKAIQAGTEAAAKQLPKSLIKRIPYAGAVTGDVAEAARTAYSEAKNPTPPPPTPEVLQAAPLAQGAKPYVDPAAGLGQIPISKLMEPQPAMTPGVLDRAAVESVTGSQASKTVNDLMGGGVPRTLSGDSALRQILTGQDNANLLKIARSRGINVSQEALLKPSVADSRLINKIIDDFSPEELTELRDQYLENTRMGKHNFGDIGPEAWKTMSLQSYFPDVKIPASQLLRTRTAITNAPLKNVQPDMAPVTDLAQQIKTTAKGLPKAKPAAPAGDLEGQLSQMLDQVKQGKTLKDLMGVSTTVDPAELSKRWGVDEESLASGREQTRDMSPKETEQSIQDLVAKYKKKGAKVDPVIEVRDAQNNIVSVDGRARVIAAQRAGIKRIPVIVRRAAAPTQ